MKNLRHGANMVTFFLAEGIRKKGSMGAEDQRAAAADGNAEILGLCSGKNQKDMGFPKGFYLQPATSNQLVHHYNITAGRKMRTKKQY